MKRRAFIGNTLRTSAVGIGALALNQLEASPEAPPSDQPTGVSPAFTFSQDKLTYAFDALEPHIDARTMEIHYGKHHTAYVNNANDALKALDKPAVTGYDDLFAKISAYPAKLRNNAGGVWNHNFFWKAMNPGATPLSGKALEAINGAFGSQEKFREQFTAAAVGQFGSGWAWLVRSNGKLVIGSTPNQDNPLMAGAPVTGTPLLAIDVWEHAYYLKYQNLRKDYIAAWWNVVNWDEVARLM